VSGNAGITRDNSAITNLIRFVVLWDKARVYLFAKGLIDGLVHQAAMVALKGESYRLRERGPGNASRPKAAPVHT
jgi:hypothetical protein